MLVESWLLNSLPLLYSSVSFIFFTLFFLPIMSYIIVTLPQFVLYFIYLFICYYFYSQLFHTLSHSFYVLPLHWQSPPQAFKIHPKKKKKFKCYFRGFKWMFCHYFDHHPRKLLKFFLKKIKCYLDVLSTF